MSALRSYKPLYLSLCANALFGIGLYSACPPSLRGKNNGTRRKPRALWHSLYSAAKCLLTRHALCSTYRGFLPNRVDLI